MKRRSFLAALAAIPIAGKLVKAEPTEWPPFVEGESITIPAPKPKPTGIEVVWDINRDGPLGGMYNRTDRGVGVRSAGDYLPDSGFGHQVLVIHTEFGSVRVPDTHKLLKVKVDHDREVVVGCYKYPVGQFGYGVLERRLDVERYT